MLSQGRADHFFAAQTDGRERSDRRGSVLCVDHHQCRSSVCLLAMHKGDSHAIFGTGVLAPFPKNQVEVGSAVG